MFVFNHSPEVAERAMRICRANQEWKNFREKYDFSWAVRLGHSEPAEGQLKPGLNDYRRHWDMYTEAFEFSHNAIPWPRDILMSLTADARRDRTTPAYYSW
eukprot:9923573-Alexandrium_andersonii.AAC.1